MSEILNPFELYFGQDGRPIGAGSLYVGVAGLDPQIHPVDVFYDREMTVPAMQPLNISGGYVWNCCAPTKVFANPADYSLKVLGKNGEQVFYCQNVEYLDEASRISYLAPFTGAVIRTQADKNADSISIKDFGAIGDGTLHTLSEKYATLAAAQIKYPFVSSLSQSVDWAAFQLAADSVAVGTQIDVYSYTTNEPVYINKKVRLNFRGAPTVIEQVRFNTPIIIVQAKDVSGSGRFKGVYNGARTTAALTLPTSSQARLTDYYALFSGAARILSTVVSTQGDVSGFDFENIDSYGFFSGSLSLANRNTDTTTDSDTIRVGEINTINTDWGVAAVGFKSMSIDILRARDIQNIFTSDPSHAIYVSPRAAAVMNGTLKIGLIDVQDVTHAAGKVDKDAFTIRSTSFANIERVVIDGMSFIGNTRDSAVLEINSLSARLSPSASVGEIIFALSAQSASKITINNCDLISQNSSSNTFANPIFQLSGSGSQIHIKSGKISVIGTNPSCVFLASGGEFKVNDGVEISYTNEIPVTATSRYAFIALTGTSFVDFGVVKLTGNASRLLDIAIADHEVKIDPNLIRAGISPLTYVNQGGVYKVSFTAFDRVGFNVAIGSTFASAQSCNTFNFLSTDAVVFTELRRPTSGQQYLLRNTGGGSILAHNDAINGIVLKGGVNIAGANWKAVLLQCIGNRSYEVQVFN